jgi:hypothetical protein
VLDDFKDSVTKIIVTEDQIIAGYGLIEIYVLYRSVDGVLRTYDLRMGKLIRDKMECMNY